MENELKVDERDMLRRIDENQKDMGNTIDKIEKHMESTNGRLGKAETRIAMIMVVGGAICGILTILTMLKQLL